MADDTRLLDQLPDALIFADGEGVIRRWNPGAERIFGHAAADAIGQRLDLIVPERFRDAHWEAFGRAVSDGFQVHQFSLQENRFEQLVDALARLGRDIDEQLLTAPFLGDDFMLG